MKRFKNILYVNDSSVDQLSAFGRAVALAERNRADLTVIDVISPRTMAAAADLPVEETSQAEGREAALVANHRLALESGLQSPGPRIRIRFDVLVGKVYLEAIRAVLRNGHDLVVKPVESPTWAQRLFGSDDLHLLRKCPCPVWLIKPPELSKYGGILAAVDLDTQIPSSVESELNREILELAASLALTDEASLHIAHAWEAFATSTILSRGGASAKGLTRYADREEEQHRIGLARLADELRGWLGQDAYASLAPRFHLVKGPAKKVIAPLAAELHVDLVVMGTVARTGISGLIIGNTAETILEQLRCSVLAIKPPGFTTPVRIGT